MFMRQLNLKFNKIILEAVYVAIWTDTAGLIERHPTDATMEAIEWMENNGIKREEIVKSLELPKEDMDLIKELVSKHSTNGLVAYKINELEVSNYIYRPATEVFFKLVDSEYYIFAVKFKGRYRVGLRSKNKDVSATAEKYNGGGHKTSSGCIAKDKETIMKIVDELATK